MLINKLGKHFFSKESLLLALGFTLFFISGIIHQNTDRPVLNVSKQDSALNFNNNLFYFFHAGNKRLIADLIWIQTLLESDMDHYKQKDLNNWLFLRFMTIQRLDPYFYENYLYGGQYLSIVKDDLEGAEELYKLAATYYPNDYHLNFHAGFMNYFEKGDFKRSLFYLEKLKDHPKSPPYLVSIINKIKFGISNDLETIFQLVFANYEATNGPHLKARLFRDLYAIRAQIDLECLNKRKTGCNQKDLDGNFYVIKEGKYQTVNAFVPYGIKIKEGVKTPSLNKN